jgi:hypothetical protein
MNDANRRFWVYDGDGEVIRMFLCKADALRYMELRPEFKLVVIPKTKLISIYDRIEEALM